MQVKHIVVVHFVAVADGVITANDWEDAVDLAMDRDGTIIGMTLCGEIVRLAVQSDTGLTILSEAQVIEWDALMTAAEAGPDARDKIKAVVLGN
jgi:uncharacterized protein YuzE